MLIRLRPGVKGAASREVLERLRRLLPAAVIRARGAAVAVTMGRPERLGDLLPRVENLPGVAGAELSLEEACPRAVRSSWKRRGFLLIAGPCAVEDEASYLALARRLKAAGAGALRAGLFKPRSSPYAFQGLGEDGYPIIRKARRATGLAAVAEIVSERHLKGLSRVCDMLQIGARNMRNYELLKAAATSGLPVLLKRAPGASLKEWLLSAEYLLRHGKGEVLLCERGDSYGRAGARGLDLEMIRRAAAAVDLRVLADPSHACGRRERVAEQALAAVEAGADGLMIEAACDPASARVDGRQALSVEELTSLLARIPGL